MFGEEVDEPQLTLVPARRFAIAVALRQLARRQPRGGGDTSHIAADLGGVGIAGRRRVVVGVDGAHHVGVERGAALQGALHIGRCLVARRGHVAVVLRRVDHELVVVAALVFERAQAIARRRAALGQHLLDLLRGVPAVAHAQRHADAVVRRRAVRGVAGDDHAVCRITVDVMAQHLVDVQVLVDHLHGAEVREALLQFFQHCGQADAAPARHLTGLGLHGAAHAAPGDGKEAAEAVGAPDLDVQV